MEKTGCHHGVWPLSPRIIALDVFPACFVEAGPEGMPAGAVATALDLAPEHADLSF